jgi:ribosome-binding ATPase YchF (GTP1/OBG family)
MDKHIFHKSILALREYIKANRKKVTHDLNEMIKKSKIKTMNTEKKKVGRPRKVKEPVITVYNPMELDLLNAERALIAKDESIVYLENKLDEAYKEQEDMLAEVNKWVFQVIHHCAEVESKTGRITLHDVDYCVDLIKRIMKHKFESKPENC